MSYQCPKLRCNQNLIVVQVGESKETKGESLAQFNPIQLCSAIQAANQPQMVHGLLYVQAIVNGVDIWAIIYSSATNNFVAD